MKWATFESWQLPQLQRLSKLDPERVESFLNTLWRQYPGLYGELAISAVDQEQLSVDACAELLNIRSEEVEERLLAFRRSALPLDTAVVHDDSAKHVARLANGQIAVWEIVREFRKLGAAERLRDSFPGVPEGELAAALRYAQEHPDEIEAMIAEYEGILAKRRSVYPFSR